MLEKIKEFTNRRKNSGVFLLFLLLFCFGLLFIKDAGVSYDEFSEQNILEMNVLAYVKFFNKDSDLISYYENNDVKPIYDSDERDHGIAPYYLFTPLLASDKVSAHTLSFCWHFFTYLLYFIGIVFFYYLIKELWGKNKIALLSTLILFFTPRFFADGFYNNKDCVLTSLIIMSLFFGIKFIKQKSKKSALIFGVVTAFACNVKISGFFIFALLGFTYIWELNSKKEWSKEKFYIGLLAIITCLAIYILITPAIWTNGLHIIDFFGWSLFNSVRFCRNAGQVWFENNLYSYVGTKLPWYYLPKIMFLTLPLFISFFLLLSLCIKGINVRKKKDTLEENEFFCLFSLLLFFPVFVAMVSKPNIYNGWRHFYFVYPSLLVLVSYALLKISENKKYQKIEMLFLSVFLFINGVGISLNGTNSMAYYNVLAKEPSINYEMDYYGVTATKNLKEIAKRFDAPTYIYAFNNWGVEINYNCLSNNYKEKVILLKTEEELNSAINKGIQPYYYVIYPMDKEIEKNIQEKEAIYTFQSFGNTLAKLYQ